MKRILTPTLTAIAIIALSLPALAAPAFVLNASGPITLTGVTCAAGAPAGAQCYSMAGSLTGVNKKTVDFTGTLETSSTPNTSSKGTCYAVLNSSTETATIGTDIVNINLVGQACIKTKKGVVTESLIAGNWIGIQSLESGTGKESWTVTPTDDLSTTAPLAGTGKITVKGTLAT